MRLVGRILHRIVAAIALLVVTVAGAPLLAGATVLAALIFLPLPATIPVAKAAPPTVSPTVIYDQFGHPIATLQAYDQNVAVTPAQIPLVVDAAVIADEDRNFFSEAGIDPKAVIRAGLANLHANAVVQGGSTITEQYVKLAYGDADRSLANKLKEAILASQIDRVTTKDDILFHYLTLVYYGDGSYGIGAAAEDYFRVPVQQLTLSEAATLAGLIPAPTARAPRENLAGAEAARELVLGKLLQQRYVTAGEYRSAMAQRLALAGPTAPAGATLIYPPNVSPSKYPAFVDYVERWLLARYPESEVFGGGLQVQTTLDPAIENDALAAVSSALVGTVAPLDMALAAVQPTTGFVEAIVGGRSFNEPLNQVNLALGGCDYAGTSATDLAVRRGATVGSTCWTQTSVTGGGSGRQPGSSWKPFVLATALEQGISPDAVYPAPQVLPIAGCKPTPQQDCAIHNDEGQGGGPTTLRNAMAASINTVYAQLVTQVGCPAVAETARALGITSAFYSPQVQPFCATYALGEVDVSPLDMASAYGVFAAHGARAAPTPILEILDSKGKVLVDNIHHAPAATQVIPSNVADNVTDVLQGPLSSPDGTAYGEGLNRPAAGKTGTTSNYTNAWFVGYTPTLSTAVWLGNTQNGNATIDYRGNQEVFGATVSAPVWHAFMTAALAGVPPTQFSQPAPIVAPTARLAPTTTTTIPQIEPRPPSITAVVSGGGPYTVTPAAPVLPPPPSTTTTTTAPPVTEPDTTTTAPSPGAVTTPTG